MKNRKRRLRHRYGRSEGLGKFQGEPPYTRGLYTEGSPDEEASYPDGGGWYGLWHIGAKDRAKWPDLDGVVGVILYERSDGFVENETFSSKSALEKAWARIEKDTSYEDD
jgi:hypothetical protein